MFQIQTTGEDRLMPHGLAAIFPMMDGEPLALFHADIATHGVRDPIVLYEGQILDGRNRYACAVSLGLDCPAVEFDGDDPLSFVISSNLHRRHLTESQRAAVAAKLVTTTHGGYRHGTQEANLPLDPTTLR